MQEITLPQSNKPLPNRSSDNNGDPQKIVSVSNQDDKKSVLPNSSDKPVVTMNDNSGDHDQNSSLSNSHVDQNPVKIVNNTQNDLQIDPIQDQNSNDPNKPTIKSNFTNQNQQNDNKQTDQTHLTTINADNNSSTNPIDQSKQTQNRNDLTNTQPQLTTNSNINSQQFSDPFQNITQDLDDNGNDPFDPFAMPRQSRSNSGTPFGNFSDPGNSDPFLSGNPGNKPSNKLSPKERVKMIEEVFEQVLGRKPDTRDINYYKYSTLGQEEIKTQLLEGKEHQKLITDGREYNKVSGLAENAQVRVRSLESQIKDQVEEFKYLSELLKQKNALIQELRAQLNNPYSMGNKDKKVISQMGVDTFRPESSTQQNNISNMGPTQNTAVGSSINRYDPVVTKQGDPESNTTIEKDQISNHDNSNLQSPYLDSNDHTSESSSNSKLVPSDIPEEVNDIEQNSQDSSNQLTDSTMDKDKYVGFFDSDLDKAFDVLNNSQASDNITSTEQTAEDSGSNPPTTVGQSFRSGNPQYENPSDRSEKDQYDIRNSQDGTSKKVGKFLDKIKESLAP